ncbi:MAG: hypothetical protein HJJLKODD_01049 [Phycisphaerae bacterium]|nr:hypothetical protein [Phycisphaerae bacterium]
MSGNFEQTKNDLQRTVREILRVLIHRRWAFIIPFCLAASVVFIVSHRLPRVYNASTQFKRTIPFTLSKLVNRRGGADPLLLLKQSMGKDMVGEEAMVGVVERMGRLKELPRDAEGHLTPAAYQQAKSMGDGLRGLLTYYAIEATEDLDEITIKATGDDPQLVVDLVNSVRENYMAFSRQQFLGILENARDFYDREIQNTTTEINSLEAKITSLGNEYPYITDNNPSSGNLAILKIRQGTLSEEVDKLRRNVQQLETRLAAMPEPLLLNPGVQNSLDPTLIETVPALEGERRRLRQLILQYQDQRAKLRIEREMRDAHPDMQALLRAEQQARADLQAIEDRLAQQQTGVKAYAEDETSFALLKQNREQVEFELRTARSDLAAKESSLASADEMINKLITDQEVCQAKRPEYRQALQDMDGAKGKLKETITDCEQLKRIIDYDAKEQGIKFEVTTVAESTVRPDQPKSRTILLLALGVGLAFGACSVFLREFFDHTFHTANAVSFSLGVQILEGIDEILLPADRRRQLLKRLVAIPVGCLFFGMLVTSGGLAYLSIEDPPKFNKIVAKMTATWDEINNKG